MDRIKLTGKAAWINDEAVRRGVSLVTCLEQLRYEAEADGRTADAIALAALLRSVRRQIDRN